MTTQIIRQPGSALAFFLWLGISANPVLSTAQSCSGSLGSVTYDTSFTSSTTASGNSGNSTTFSYSIPQFPVTTQTLYAVAIHSTVSASASVEVQNVTTNTVTPSVKLYRSDDAYSDPTGDINNVYLSGAFASSPVAAGGTITLVSAHVLNNYKLLSDSVNSADAALNDYIGGGTVYITYSASSTPLVSNNVSVLSSTVTDVIHFTVTYYYCNPGTLATDLLAFTAIRKNTETIALGWITGNEQPGRNYTVEMSMGGSGFSPVVTMAADPAGGSAAYAYDYTIRPADKGLLSYRIRLTDADGTISYSPVRAIDIGTGATPATGGDISIYPNPPADFINVGLPRTAASWQIDIMTADGSLAQRNYFHDTDAGRVNFLRKLSAGTYFVRAIDLQTMKTFSAAFVKW